MRRRVLDAAAFLQVLTWEVKGFWEQPHLTSREVIKY